MSSSRVWGIAVILALTAMSATPVTQSETAPKLERYKQEVTAGIDGMYDFAQQMVDSVFNYYDPPKYKTYLDQLGIQYPTVREPAPIATGQ